MVKQNAAGLSDLPRGMGPAPHQLIDGVVDVDVDRTLECLSRRTVKVLPVIQNRRRADEFLDRL